MTKKTARTKTNPANVPLDLRVNFAACLSADCTEANLLTELMVADALAAAILSGTAGESFGPAWNHVTTLAEAKKADETAADAKRAIAHYFRTTKQDCTTPENAAEEIVGELQWRPLAPAFMLGFCMARRLTRAGMAP